MRLPRTLRDSPRTALGLVVLQNDETIERDARAMVPPDTDLFVSRIPCGLSVTPDTLAAMEHDLPAAAALFPQGRALDVVGYGCTSGTARIGADRVHQILTGATGCERVTDPLSALIATCHARGLARLAILSPYTADVSDRLRERLSDAKIATPHFASFETPEESLVARITPDSIADGAIALARQAGEAVDAIFLSCTNLDTRDAAPRIERETGLPCLSSNGVLLGHMLSLARAGAD